MFNNALPESSEAAIVQINLERPRKIQFHIIIPQRIRGEDSKFWNALCEERDSFLYSLL